MRQISYRVIPLYDLVILLVTQLAPGLKCSHNLGNLNPSEGTGQFSFGLWTNWAGNNDLAVDILKAIVPVDR